MSLRPFWCVLMGTTVLAGCGADQPLTPNPGPDPTGAPLETVSASSAALAGSPSCWTCITQITCGSSPNGGGATSNHTIDLASRRVTIRLERSEAVVCTFAASTPIWEQGDFLTYPQGEWGDIPAVNPAATLLDLRFNEVYTSGTLEVGIAGTAGFSLVVDGNGALAYLPAPGAPGTLTSDLFNPPFSSAGSFGGDVVAGAEY